jgi:hypothetical protein
MATDRLNKKVLIVQHLISFSHAMQMIKRLKIKKHAALGFYYELVDLGMTTTCRLLSRRVPEFVHPKSGCLEMYSDDYKSDTDLFHLKVYRDIA